jgi:hypothetical protein
VKQNPQKEHSDLFCGVDKGDQALKGSKLALIIDQLGPPNYDFFFKKNITELGRKIMWIIPIGNRVRKMTIFYFFVLNWVGGSCRFIKLTYIFKSCDSHMHF